MRYALQLYKLKDIIKDLDSLKVAFKQIKSLGIEAVEFAGTYYDLDPKDIKAALDECGLSAFACHEPLEKFEADLDGLLQLTKQFDCERLIMSRSPCDSKEVIERTIEVLKIAKEKAEPMGIKILYHNHGHEFIIRDGLLPMDEVQKGANIEFDSFWAIAKGYDPIKYFNEHKDVMEVVHAKDGFNDGKLSSYLGEGDSDVTGILTAAKNAGIEWFVINDKATDDAIDCLAKSMEFLKNLDK